MKNQKVYRTGIVSIIFLAGLLGWSWAAQDSPAKPTEQVASICLQIEQGQFDQAHKAIQAISPATPESQFLGTVVGNYISLQQQLVGQRQSIYQTQTQKLFELLERSDPNRSDKEVLDRLLKAYEYAENETQKKDLLHHQKVKLFLEGIHSKSKTLYEQEKLVEAMNGYAYLRLFEPQDAFLAQVTEEAEAFRIVSGGLRKSICRDVARFDTIRPEVFLEVLKTLDTGYVTPLDYRQMAQKALQRCLMLGLVFRENNTEFMFTADSKQVDDWCLEIELLMEKLRGEKNALTPQQFEGYFQSVLTHNQNTLKLPAGVIVEHYADASLAALDPYTNIVWPDKVADFEKGMTGKFSGVGIQLAREDKYIKAVSIIPDSPAWKSEILAGDLIVAVNGQSTQDVPIDCVVKQISGPKDSQVTLTIQRGQGQPMDIQLTRGEVVVPAVQGTVRSNGDAAGNQWDYLLNTELGIGYIQVQSFTEGISKKTEDILSQLEQKKLHGLILDLRGDGGGLLNEAAELAGLFLDQGTVVASRDRKGQAAVWSAKGKGKKRQYPIVILMDSGTASAAEIVAGALGCKLYDRAILVGSRSYGKGSVQEIIQGKWDGCELKFTTAFYYLPDGSPVQNRYMAKRENRTDWGITPTVEVDLKSGEIKSLLEFRQKLSEKAGPDIQHGDLFAADPQLSAAVTVLKARMLRQGQISLSAPASSPAPPEPAAQTPQPTPK
ncbi:MAG: S41 family peptidase [Sedimentisphaerales bacterium]|nr:S41 family peptidase [Sedimentisphaerales bacterium]